MFCYRWAVWFNDCSGCGCEKVKRLKTSPELKSRFVERLSLFIEYELKQQFDKQFDLLATNCPEYLHCRKPEREEYAKQKSEQMRMYGKLLELQFDGIPERKLKDNCVGIILSPKLRDKDKVYYNASSAIACLDDNDWFFRFDLVEI